MAALAAIVATGNATAQERPEGWQPPVPTPDTFDWIQLKSGEWLGGKLIAMYDETLEFDSEELDDQQFEWEDVRQVRTARAVRVAFLDGSVATGRLVMEGTRVILSGELPFETIRSQVLSITSGAARVLDLWSGDLSLGINYRTGNTSQAEGNATASLKLRTPRDRASLNYLGNFSRTDGVTTADNQRISSSWDHFVSDRFYLTPAYVEYYRDPFQNIVARWTVGTGVGFQLVDTKRVDWSVGAGLGYQRTSFDQVSAGEPPSDDTPALTLSTRYDNELTKWVDLFVSYKAYLVDEGSGTYTHNLWAGLEFEFFKDLEFDVSVVWDRIEDPRPDADGTLPKQDDFRTIVAFGYRF